ncbi:hypothetical protein [Xanthomonas axonopodis]|uniref:hypothetical protein n=1 Tax=Xanthomonas axonopodis TaxID=53413 RepID=UPI000EFF7070|nr:hypothetical protein [Xanthomonas axonopodis]AYO95535.1 hypothetical protein Xcom_11390 [Xanthomonas axonopodis pv. commiphoreae]
MLEKKIKVGDDASWLPRKEGELTGSGGLIEVPGTVLEGYATKYLPFIPNAIRGSTPFSRTLTRRPIKAMRSVHVKAQEVHCRVQAWRG